jgi:glycosyltransferase involved in cell wall biosynthesis
MHLSNEDKHKICIVSLYSYPLFNSACISPFGGSEVRMSIIARELALFRDLDVTVLVFDHGQGTEVRDGVIIRPWPGRCCPIRADHPKAEPTMLTAAASSSLGKANKPNGADSTASAAQVWMNARHAIKAHAPRCAIDLARRLRYEFDLLASGVHKSYAAWRGKQPYGQIDSHVIRRDSIQIYDDIGASIYMMHGNHNWAAELAYYCVKNNKKYVMSAGSDHDFEAARHTNSNTDMYGSFIALMKYTIKNAHMIIAQNRHQADLAKNIFGREAIVIPNPVDLTLRCERDKDANTILWVGKSDDRIKLPDLFLDLVAKRPQYHFEMIMNIAIDSVHKQILERGKNYPNLKMITFIPYEQIEKHYAGARLLVNTSLFEGFPNTFLQAAKYGVPIVSLQVNPNEMISQHGCGLLCNGDFDLLVENVSRLMTDQTCYSKMASACTDYVSKHHEKSVVARRYHDAIV